MQSSKVFEEDAEKRALTLLETTKIPVSVGYVAYHLKVTWQTARSLLLKMCLTRKISAIETTKGYTFTTLKKPGDN